MARTSADARPTRVDPRIAQTRQLVRAATLELIAEVGFEGTTIELISERSGVSRSTIYRHWPNPSDLYLQAFDPTESEREVPAITGDVRADLRAYVQHVADRLNDELYSAALTAQIEKGRRDPAYRKAQLAYAVERNKRGVSIIHAGVAAGIFRTDIDPAYETDVVLSQLVYRRLMRYQLIDASLVDRILVETWARLAKP